MNGDGQISVSTSQTRKPSADGGQDAPKVEGIKFAQHAARFTEVKDAEFSARFERPVKLTQSRFVIRKVAEAEGRGDEIEPVICHRKMKRVGLDRDNVAISEFLFSAGQHRVGKVACKNHLCHLWTMAEQRQRHISCSAADVED